MKIFISQPMRGLDDETIKARREKAIAFLKETYPGCEVIDSFFEGEATPDNPLQLLGKSISMLHGVDAIYMLEGWQNANGCCIEHECAIRYGKTVIYENPVSGSEETLADTIPYMLSNDWKERFIGEYKQLRMRIDALDKRIDRIEEGKVLYPNFIPIDLETLKDQQNEMYAYIDTLKKRASIYDIDLKKYGEAD